MRIIESRDGEREAKVAAAMIGSPTVLARVAPKWEESGFFSSPHCNLIAGWCVNHYLKHQTHPGKGIIHIFESWKDKSEDEETSKLVESQLSALLDRWEDMEDTVTPEALVDLAGEHFNRVRLKKLSEAIEGDLATGKLDKAEERINAHCKVELGAGSSVHLLNDDEEIRSTFDSVVHENLIELPGDLGIFFGRSLRRGGFVAFEGPEKSGKSWFLLDLAYRALEQRRRVAYFQVGDLTKTELKERFLVRIAKHPLHPETFPWPIAMELEDGHVVARCNEKTFDTGLTADLASSSCAKLLRKKLKTKRVFLKISCHSNMSVQVSDMRNILESWAREDWNPDIVVCDYMDVLANPTRIREYRDQINYNWAMMRSISQDFHCLVLTATQLKRTGYTKRYITNEDTADDKRKLSHITGMVGISRNDDDIDGNVCRLNWASLRGERFTSNRTVTVAQCLSLAQPTVLSMFNPKRKNKSEEKEE